MNPTLYRAFFVFMPSQAGTKTMIGTPFSFSSWKWGMQAFSTASEGHITLATKSSRLRYFKGPKTRIYRDPR